MSVQTQIILVCDGNCGHTIQDRPDVSLEDSRASAARDGWVLEHGPEASEMQDFCPECRPKLTICKMCGAYINPKFEEFHPLVHEGAAGTKEDPRSPGDYDDVCAPCGYTE